MAVTVIVGFGAALLGAVAGFLGAVYIESNRTRRTRLGMVRALVSELRENGVAAILGGRPSFGMEFSSETWRASRFELAQFLDKGVYEDIWLLYLTLPKVSQLARRGRGHEKANVSWVERARTTMIALQLLLPADMRVDIRVEEDTETTPP